MVHTLLFNDGCFIAVTLKSAEFLKPTDFIFENGRLSQPVKLQGKDIIVKYVTTARLEGCN